MMAPLQGKPPPLAGDGVSDNPSGMAAFSSRGPAPDGRHIAYGDNAALHHANLESGARTAIETASLVLYKDLSLNADGRFLVYTRTPRTPATSQVSDGPLISTTTGLPLA